MVAGFHPDPLHERPPGPGGDESAPAFAAELERGVAVDGPMPRPWGAFSSALAAFLSLGVLPLLLWHDRFRDYVDEERRHLRRFAEWLRLRSSRPETIDLRVAAEDLGTRPVLSGLSVLSVVGVVILFATQLSAEAPIVKQLMSYTYDFRPPRTWRAPLNPRQQLFIAWSIGLSVAYLFHWLQVRAHASDVRRYVQHANRVLRADDGVAVAPLPTPRRGISVGFLWLVVGILLAGKGAWWGLAMALSGAAQHRYMSTDSTRLRRALAARVREMTRGTPAVDGVTPAASLTAGRQQRCAHVRCLAPVARGARFCPRCGQDVQTTAAAGGPPMSLV